ncbi:isochorismatase family cysteine hydrolase [Streptomyces yokosukanensis]
MKSPTTGTPTIAAAWNSATVTPRSRCGPSPTQQRIGLGGGVEFTDEDPGAEIHPDIAPRPADPVVTRTPASAFVGSDLDLLLRAHEIDGLILTGIATSGVVLSTLRQAADLDFGLTVLADGCLDADAEVHQVLTEKVFPVQADVVTVDDWITSIK